MQLFKAIPISGYIFVGRVRKISQPSYPTFEKHIDKSNIVSEISALQQAIQRLENRIKDSLTDPNLNQIDKDILNTHLLIVTDIEITQILENSLASELLTAPQAVMTTFEKIIRNFEQMDNNYFAQRADDYKDVANRLMKILLGEKDELVTKYSSEDIVFVKEITPSVVSNFAKSGVKAYCSEHGSYTSHSSILSRALGLTAVVCSEDILNKITNLNCAILDAVDGKVIIEPDTNQLEFYQKQISLIKEKEKRIKADLEMPTVTKNNITVSIKANVEYPQEVKAVQDNKCDGVGLFRTEFLYLNRYSSPNEQEQTEVYSEFLKQLNGKKAVIRTFDLGGDKLSFLQHYKREENPYLGSRGIRFSLQERELFKTQLRSILKASVHGQVEIMFPMIIGVDDYNSALEVLNECKGELDKECIDYKKDIPIGAMIETPSAALCADRLAEICDFFSIGTNDLVQYTLAVDRNNDKVAPYYVQYHPAVILMIKNTLEAAFRAEIPVAVCGEAASDPKMVPLLIGLGLRELSINPEKSAQVKAVIRQCDQTLFNLVSSFDFNTNIKSVESFINEILKPYYTI